MPGTGYVGVGEVVSPAVRFNQFKMSVQGVATPIVNVEVEAPEMFDEEHGEHIVGVKWTKTVDLHEAVKEIGFFGNQKHSRETAGSELAFHGRTAEDALAGVVATLFVDHIVREGKRYTMERRV